MTTILQAINNDKLLGRSFPRKLFGRDSWRPWKSYMCAFFGLPFEDAEAFELFRQCTARTIAPTKPFNESFLIVGRRGGKSHGIAAIATYAAGFMDFAPYLSAGEVPVIVICASDKNQAGIILKYIKANFAQSPILRQMVAADLKEGLLLKSGLEILVMAGDFRSVRGRTIVACLLDELAFYASDGSSPDVELLNAIRPGMISIPNSFLIGISSPYARKGVLFSEYQQHYGKDDSATLIWKADSKTMNPTLNQKAIAAAYLKDPASARSEYGAEWRSDLEGYVSLEAVCACVVAGRYELPYKRGHDYKSFCDPSGGRSDSMTLGIAHAEGDVSVLDLLAETPAPFSPEQTVKVFSDILSRYKISEVTGDRYSGEWVAEAFQKEGITYRASEKNRSQIYADFLPQLMSRQTQLLDDQRIISQLTSLERRTGRGADIIDHPPGPNFHDDCANAISGALDLCASNGGDFSLFDYLTGVTSGKFRDPSAELEANPRTTGDCNRMFELQRKMRGLEHEKINHPAFQVEPVPACPQCRATVTVRIAGFVKCNQCAFQFDETGREQKVLFATRGRDGSAGVTLKAVKR